MPVRGNNTQEGKETETPPQTMRGRGEALNRDPGPGTTVPSKEGRVTAISARKGPRKWREESLGETHVTAL